MALLIVILTPYGIFWAQLLRTAMWFPALAIAIAVGFCGVFYGPFYSFHFFVKGAVMTVQADAVLPICSALRTATNHLAHRARTRSFDIGTIRTASAQGMGWR